MIKNAIQNGKKFVKIFHCKVRVLLECSWVYTASELNG